DVLARVLERRAGLQPRHHLEVAVGPRARVLERRLRDPQLGLFRKLKLRRHDADDRVWVAVDRDRAADDRRIGGVAALPDAVAQEHYARSAGRVFFLPDLTSENRLDADHRK